MSTTAPEKFVITERPVVGDITRSNRHDVDQISPAEFLARLDAVLAFPEVEYVQWDQYTPYFNDGEPCVFSVGEVGVRVTGVDEDAGDYGDGILTEWDLNPRYGREGLFDGPDWAGIHVALEKLNQSGEWERIALENFGDHAEVRATKDGFSVEYYEHE